MGASQVLDRSVAAYARAVIAELDPDVPVTPVTWEGRTAWSITVPEPLAGGGSDGTARIVVDAQSGYPLAVEHWTSDGEVSGTRIENVRIGGDVPRSRFALAVGRPGQAPADERALPPHEPAAGGRPRPARRRRAFTPYATTWVPRGYRLSGVTGAVNGAFMGAYRPVRDGRGRLAHRRPHVPARLRPLLHRQPLARATTRPGSDDPFDEDSVALSESTRVAARLRRACAARPRSSSSACPTGRTSTSAPAPTAASRSAWPATSPGTSWRASPAPSGPIGD